MSRACPSCGAPTPRPALDFGPQPLCNRFLAALTDPEYTHPLRIGQCERCGLVQLVDPVPAAELRPRFEWISYQEPEGHLDHLAGMLRARAGDGAAAVVGGLSYKDDTTLARLSSLGASTTWRVSPREDLGLAAAHAEIETVQDGLSPETAREVLRRHPPADILLARHILEHVHDMDRFLAAVRVLVRPGGRVVFESPDCERAFHHRDYTTVWEEHLLYFTPMTFRDFFPRRGMALDHFACYPYPFEHSLVAVAAFDEAPQAGEGTDVAGERALFEAFAADFAPVRGRVRAALEAFRAREGRIALMGAGHAAVTYLSLFGLAGIVEFVVDDNPRKAGLLMPGSRLPIRPSAALLEEGIKLCLLAVSAAAEPKVLERQHEFSARGGRFASISPLSPLALRA